MPDIETITQAVVRDIREGRDFALQPLGEAPDEMAMAYAVQAKVVARLAEDRGDIAGYKLAFNRASSMEYYGLEEPCFAPVFAGPIHASGHEIEICRHHHLLAESETCITLGKDVPAGPLSRAIAIGCIASVHAAFELLDHRGAFVLDPSAAQAVAQGIYNVGAVLGEPSTDLSVLEGTQASARLLVDGQVEAEGVNAAPQDPVDAVLWLASTLARQGTPLKAGMIVLCGTHLPAKEVSAPCGLVLEMTGLGAVRLTAR